MEAAVTIVVLVVSFFLYFLPTICARFRNHRSGTAIFLLNLLLGWIVLPWVIALVWAFTENVDPITPKRVPRGCKLCPECGRIITQHTMTCYHCGENLNAKKQCPECLARVPVQANKCMHCGSVLRVKTEPFFLQNEVPPERK